MPNNIVLLFEDTPSDRKEFEIELKKAFVRQKADIVAFGNSAAPVDAERVPYEIRLEKALAKFLGRTTLIVCDQDLSGIENYIGLSETVVSAVADEFGLPVALYARGKKPAGKQMLERLKVRKPWTERKIILDLDGKTFGGLAKDAVEFYKGFQYISKSLSSIHVTGRQSLAGTMAAILEEPALINTLALYGSGDQQYLQSVMPNVTDKKRAMRQVSTALGYWLWESILRFPGIVVNEIAAASFLNIDPSQFAKDTDVVKLFASARYEGPFGAIGKYWWRHKLQALLDANKVEDGLSLIQSKYPNKKCKGCFCSVDATLRAGYYCMVTEKPVSEKHSRAQIAWFPAGADLARIELKTFAKYGPWLGLY